MERLIYTDRNQVTVRAVESLSDGTDVTGHEYRIVSGPLTQNLSFQLGPVKEEGVNGMTTEALLHVLIDRTKVLDAKHPSLLNVAAIRHMKAALSSLEQRTADRITRGVEGFDTP